MITLKPAIFNISQSDLGEVLGVELVYEIIGGIDDGGYVLTSVRFMTPISSVEFEIKKDNILTEIKRRIADSFNNL